MKKKLSLKRKTISIIDAEQAQQLKGGSYTPHCNSAFCPTAVGCTVFCPPSDAFCGTGPCTTQPCGSGYLCTEF